MIFHIERRLGSIVLVLTLLGSCLPALAQSQQPPSGPPEKSPGVHEGSFEQGTAPAQPATVPASGQPAAVPVPASPDQPAPAPSSEVRLGSGDLLEMSVYGVPELASKVRVGSTGDLYLPLINYVHVGDLTIEEAQKLIEKRYEDGGFVKDPHVSLFITEYSSQGIAVLGEVLRPGVYPALGDRRLIDMLTAAGGLNDRAGRKVTITHRGQSDKQQVLELSRTLTDNPDINTPVFPGDTIEVQRAPIIYVVGDVAKPSGLLIDNGKLTVLQALALVGGANHTAKLNDARILRKSSGPTGMTETKVQLKRMLENKSPDMPLEANDILFVPLSGAKIAAARSFEAAMTVTTGLAIYAVHP